MSKRNLGETMKGLIVLLLIGILALSGCAEKRFATFEERQAIECPIEVYVLPGSSNCYETTDDVFGSNEIKCPDFVDSDSFDCFKQYSYPQLETGFYVCEYQGSDYNPINCQWEDSFKGTDYSRTGRD